MKTCWFVVIEVRGTWWVDCEGRAYGPLESKDEASVYAIKIAQAYRDPVRRADVYVHDDRGKLVLTQSIDPGRNQLGSG